jgi:hypothetical protein
MAVVTDGSPTALLSYCSETRRLEQQVGIHSRICEVPSSNLGRVISSLTEAFRNSPVKFRKYFRPLSSGTLPR